MEEGRVLMGMDVMELQEVNAYVMMLEMSGVKQETTACFKGSGYPRTIVY